MADLLGTKGASTANVHGSENIRERWYIYIYNYIIYIHTYEYHLFSSRRWPYWQSWPDLSPFAKARFALPDYLTEHVWGWVSKFDLLATQQPSSFREFKLASPAQVSVLRMLGVRDAVELPQESLVGQETDSARVLSLSLTTCHSPQPSHKPMSSQEWHCKIELCCLICLRVSVI